MKGLRKFNRRIFHDFLAVYPNLLIDIDNCYFFDFVFQQHYIKGIIVFLEYFNQLTLASGIELISFIPEGLQKKF
jgi:hypothetical protein